MNCGGKRKSKRRGNFSKERKLHPHRNKGFFYIGRGSPAESVEGELECGAGGRAQSSFEKLLCFH